MYTWGSFAKSSPFKINADDLRMRAGKGLRTLCAMKKVYNFILRVNSVSSESLVIEWLSGMNDFQMVRPCGMFERKALECESFGWMEIDKRSKSERLIELWIAKFECLDK